MIKYISAYNKLNNHFLINISEEIIILNKNNDKPFGIKFYDSIDELLSHEHYSYDMSIFQINVNDQEILKINNKLCTTNFIVNKEYLVDEFKLLIKNHKFDQYNNLIKKTDSSGYFIVSKYDKNNNMFESVYNYNNIDYVNLFEYDKYNNMISFKSSSGKHYIYEYDQYNNLILIKSSNNHYLQTYRYNIDFNKEVFIKTKIGKNQYLSFETYDKNNMLINNIDVNNIKHFRHYNENNLLFLYENSLNNFINILYNNNNKIINYYSSEFNFNVLYN